MKTEFRKSFERDLKRISRDAALFQRIRDVLAEVEGARTLSEVTSLKRLSGGNGTYYRIRIGDYRLGLEFLDGTVVFVRCLHRRDLYRYFP